MSEPGTRAWEEARAERAEAENERLRMVLAETLSRLAVIARELDAVVERTRAELSR